MKAIQVRAKGSTKNVVFDQPDAGIELNRPVRVVIRANGKAHTVDGTHKLIKAAIERGDLISLEPAEEAHTLPEAKK